MLLPLAYTYTYAPSYKYGITYCNCCSCFCVVSELFNAEANSADKQPRLGARSGAEENWADIGAALDHEAARWESVSASRTEPAARIQ